MNHGGGMTNGIAVLGIFVADVVFRSERLPELGETLIGRGFSLGPGGKGSNQAVAAARLGGDVVLLTKIGDDPFGAMAHAIWSDAGVRAELGDPKGEGTGAAGIFVLEDSGDNAIVVCPSASGTVSIPDVDAWSEVISGARIFLTQLEQPVEPTNRALQVARSTGVMTIFNPAPAAPLPEGILSLCDYVTPNETELEQLTGVPCATPKEASKGARILLDQGAGAVVATLGGHGALYCSADEEIHVPAFDAGRVVDTTGAGDAFNGAFAVALAGGSSPVDAVRFGCAAGSLSVTRIGTASAMPDRDAVESLLS